MRRYLATFNTDGVNLQNIAIPAAVMSKAIENMTRSAAEDGRPVEMPTNIQHDMHRCIGTNTTLGMHFSKGLVRHIGYISEAETDDEKSDLENFRNIYWEHYDTERTKKYTADLLNFSGEPHSNDHQFIGMEAAAIHKTEIAAHAYPHLFNTDTQHVDKDGLLDYRYLLTLFTHIQPGVFKDKSSATLLFAHPYFRRSLSRRNSLNSYFLSAFKDIADTSTDLTFRIRLDPDTLGHHESALEALEFEYWRGPRYTPSIDEIPAGVTEHKADPRTRWFEGIDKTQIWWKAAEERDHSQFRTFECEELVENPSFGLDTSEAIFGCRYAHSEFDSSSKNITHFDGAIRAYDSEKYLNRIDLSIDRAGKNSIYTKLFRIDGPIEITQWEELLINFYRGNPLISEYFSNQPEAQIEGDTTRNPDTDVTAAPPIAALVSISKPHASEKTSIEYEDNFNVGDSTVEFLELGRGELGALLGIMGDLSSTRLVVRQDKTLNFPRIYIGTKSNVQSEFEAHVGNFCTALSKDIASDAIKTVSFALAWNVEGICASLSVSGEATKVEAVLRDLPSVVLCTEAPHKWVPALKRCVDRHSPELAQPLDLANTVTLDGRLKVARTDGPAPIWLLEPSEQMPFMDALSVGTKGKQTPV